MECIVLAGGPGTRLRGVIGEMPKCMALVAGKPFLHYLFDYLAAQGCTRVLLSLGYKHEMVETWLDQTQWPFSIEKVIETEPLGTGGGISLALSKAQSRHVAVINGDTMFCVDLPAMMNFHLEKKSDTTLALNAMKHFDRYGVVTIDENNCVQSFEEKKYYNEGLVNGGIYIIDKQALSEQQLPERYSFEQDYLQRFVAEGRFYGFRSGQYFIDIGIPSDYERAQQDFMPGGAIFASTASGSMGNP